MIFIQVSFETGVAESACRVQVISDTIFEGEETFVLELSSPVKTILSEPKTATITIHDEEDGK